MSGTKAAALGLWLLCGLVLAVAAWSDCVYLAALACVLSAGAAVVHIKGYMCQQSAGYQIAYDLGRDAGRLEGIPSQRRGMHPVD